MALAGRRKGVLPDAGQEMAGRFTVFAPGAAPRGEFLEPWSLCRGSRAGRWRSGTSRGFGGGCRGGDRRRKRRGGDGGRDDEFFRRWGRRSGASGRRREAI